MCLVSVDSAGFGVNRSCIDNVCTLNEINYARQIEGR